MLEFGRPAFLTAGALLALAPLLLHLIARRPPEPSPLPTARFLRRDTRTALRIERRPTDLLLLVLRSLFLLLLALGFSAPRWVPARAGSVDLILLDRGRGMAAGWSSAVDTARALAAGAANARVVVFDTVVTTFTASAGDDVDWNALRSRGVAGAESDYAVALRSLAALAGATRADSALVWLVTAPRWGAWPAGFPIFRKTAWPGAVRIVEVAYDTTPAVLAALPRTGSLLGADSGFARAALEAVGVEFTHDVSAAGLLLAVDTSIGEVESTALLERVRAGATLIVAGGALRGMLADEGPWRFTDGPAASSPVTFDDETRLDEAGIMRSGAPRAGAALIAAGANGRAAATSAAHGAGCIVYYAGSLSTPQVALAQGYSAALRRLVAGCTRSPGTGTATEGTDGLPLDSAASAVLAGRQLPPAVALAAIATSAAGRPLGRAILAVAILIALVETGLSQWRRTRD